MLNSGYSTPLILCDSFVCFCVEQEMKQRQKALAKQTEALSQGERLLARQRYHFGEGWPQTSMVEAAYADYETILGRRYDPRPQS